MLILAVDTSGATGSVAVLRDSRVVGQVAECSSEPYSSRLFRHVHSLFKELSLALRDVDVLAVGAGPGSFTGLRVGLTAVKAWAEVYGKPIVPVSGLEAVAAQAGPSDGMLGAVLDARRGQIFGGLYRPELERLVRLGEEVVMTAGEFLEYIGKQNGSEALTFVTPTPGLVVDAVRESEFRKARIEGVSPVLAPIIGRLGYARAQRGEVVDAIGLDANYVRRSDAEQSWKRSP
jgi:tRNA threonylcarbamoyladenosine biosynthesis protein TsaB